MLRAIIEVHIALIIMMIIIKDNVVSKSTTKAIFDQIKKETEIFGWKSKTRSKKRMGIIIYDILTET